MLHQNLKLCPLAAFVSLLPLHTFKIYAVTAIHGATFPLRSPITLPDFYADFSSVFIIQFCSALKIKQLNSIRIKSCSLTTTSCTPICKHMHVNERIMLYEASAKLNCVIIKLQCVNRKSVEENGVACQWGCDLGVCVFTLWCILVARIMIQLNYSPWILTAN